MIPREAGALPGTGYGVEPYELNPSEKRTKAVADMFISMGYDERKAYQMANKITGSAEGLAEQTPLAMKLAEERGEPIMNASLLSGLPGAMIVKQLARNTNKVKQIDNALIELRSKMNERPGEKAFKKLRLQKEQLEEEKRFLEKEAENLKPNLGDMLRGDNFQPFSTKKMTEKQLSTLKGKITAENEQLNKMRDMFKDFE